MQFLYTPQHDVVLHRGQDNPLGPSPRVLGSIHAELIAPDGCGGGVSRLLDAVDVGNLDTVAGAAFDDVNGQVGIRADIGAAVTPQPTEPGVSRISTGATNANEIYVVSDFNIGSCVEVGQGSIGFEARIRANAAGANADLGVLAGLVAPGVGADTMVAATLALADTDFIGFHNREGEASALQFVYRAAGQPAQYVDIASEILADTWIKVGFVIRHDPADPGKKVLIFVNNKEVGSISTAAYSAATFPKTAMACMLGVKNTVGADRQLDFTFFGAIQSSVAKG